MHNPEQDQPTQRFLRTPTGAGARPFGSRFEIDDATRVCVVSLCGNLDSAAVDDLHPQVQELVRAGYRRFVFDLAGLEYIGSLGLRLFMALANQLKGNGILAICELEPKVRSVIEATKVDTILKPHATREEAVAAAVAGA
ncbi:MAG TPA: STAS domain-containing protein [Gemmata sp.]|nr:STAS domain-containing protein [Gemmata sp.]